MVAATEAAAVVTEAALAEAVVSTAAAEAAGTVAEEEAGTVAAVAAWPGAAAAWPGTVRASQAGISTTDSTTGGCSSSARGRTPITTTIPMITTTATTATAAATSCGSACTRATTAGGFVPSKSADEHCSPKLHVEREPVPGKLVTLPRNRSKKAQHAALLQSVRIVTRTVLFAKRFAQRQIGSPTVTRAAGRVRNYFSTLMGYSGVHEDSA